ncbi:MAG: hypothetical protein ACFE95_08790 [Candidatus Hodarchaeota archaeon]
MEQRFKILEMLINVNKNIRDPSLMSLTIFPLCIPANTYGTTLFWVEEYWTFLKIEKLRQKYPHLDFTGLIDPIFEKNFLSLIKKDPHKKIFDIKSYMEISDILWESEPHVLNIATSHAPSRFIAQSYYEEYRDDFGILTIDAHFDFVAGEFIHGAWLTNDLVRKTAIIGGWAENVTDLNNITSLAFYSPSLNALINKRNFIDWLEGKKLYITLDLDYYQPSKSKFLGYSNYWHRDKVIGHSMNIEQELEKYNIDKFLFHPFLIGKYLGYFSDLDNFVKQKKNSIKMESSEIFRIISLIAKVCQKNSAKLLSIDFVEYSPICDWQQLTINEFIGNYSKLLSIITPIIH